MSRQDIRASCPFGAIFLLFLFQFLVAAAPQEMPNETLEEAAAHSKAPHWNYLNQELWTSQFPQCKGLNLRQSPIDIVTSKVKFSPTLKLEFSDYHQEVEFEFKNTGHSISLTPIVESGRKPTVRINWLPDGDEFELAEIHFHWGDGINKGSEHEINDQRAAAEVSQMEERHNSQRNLSTLCTQINSFN